VILSIVIILALLCGLVCVWRRCRKYRVYCH